MVANRSDRQLGCMIEGATAAGSRLMWIKIAAGRERHLRPILGLYGITCWRKRMPGDPPFEQESRAVATASVAR